MVLVDARVMGLKTEMRYTEAFDGRSGLVRRSQIVETASERTTYVLET